MDTRNLTINNGVVYIQNDFSFAVAVYNISNTTMSLFQYEPISRLSLRHTHQRCLDLRRLWFRFPSNNTREPNIATRWWWPWRPSSWRGKALGKDESSVTTHVEKNLELSASEKIQNVSYRTWIRIYDKKFETCWKRIKIYGQITSTTLHIRVVVLTRYLFCINSL